VKISFCLSVTDNQNRRKKKQFSFSIAQFVQCFRLLLFVLFIYLCDLAFIYHRSKQKITNCVYVCVVLLFVFLLYRVNKKLIRDSKKRNKGRRVIAEWMKICLILCHFCLFVFFCFVIISWWNILLKIFTD
jgi:TRAP-type uncharacterized transport system fused permease subunit